MPAPGSSKCCQGPSALAVALIPTSVLGRAKGLSCREVIHSPTTLFCVSVLSTLGEWGGGRVCLRPWPGHKLWLAAATVDPGSSPYHSLAPKDKMPSPEQERPMKACLLLRPSPHSPCLFVLTLDFGDNGKPGWMFALWGQGSVAWAPANFLPEGSLDFGLTGGTMNQERINMVSAWEMRVWKMEWAGLGVGPGVWGS